MEHSDVGSDLERFRQYLQLLARGQVEPALQAKVDLSGIVQQTLLEAFQALQANNGEISLKAAWLRQILKFARYAAPAGMLPGSDLWMPASKISASRLEAWLALSQSSPSKKADANEQALRLADALAQLPDAQREALVLQHWHGWSLAKMAEHLERTPAAVAGLLHRGLKQLRRRWKVRRRMEVEFGSVSY